MNDEQKEFLEAINHNYEQGFSALNTLDDKPRVTIYGSARLKPDHPIYKDVEKVAHRLRMEGYNIITGGGPGIMEAAFSCDVDAEHNSICYRIKGIKDEQEGTLCEKYVGFDYFSVRKYFLRQSDIFIVAPGGFGTLDELMDLIDLIKTEKIKNKPIYLYNSGFWNGMVNWLGDVLADEVGTISREDMKLFKVVDSVDEILADL